MALRQGSPVPSPSKRRLRELVEAARVATCTQDVDARDEAEAWARQDKYYTRWRHLRSLHAYYASRPAPLLPALHVACFEACVQAHVPLSLLESILIKCLGLDARDKQAIHLVRAVLDVIAEPSAHGLVVDYRRVTGMWDTLEQPLLAPRDRISRWFYVYASTKDNVEAIQTSSDLSAMCTLASSSPLEEAEVDHCLKDFFAEARAKRCHTYTLSDLLAYAESHPWLPKLLDRQVWHILPDAIRLKYHRDKYGFSVLRVEQERYAVRLQLAVRTWSLAASRAHLHRWREWTHLSRRKKRGERHWQLVQCARGLAGFRDHCHRRRWMHVREVVARTQYHKSLLARVILDWCFFQTAWRALDMWAAARAERSRPPRLLRPVYTAWIQYTQLQFQLRRERHEICVAKARAVRAQLLQTMVAAWTYFVVLQKRDRQAAARQDAMVAADIERARVEREVAQMKIEDAIAREVLAREKKEVERARAAAFRAQTEQIKKMRKQRELIEYRTAKKIERQRRLDAANDAAWAEIEAMAKAKAREAAAKWLATPEGKAKLLESATYIYETDPSTVVAGLQADPAYGNVPNCVWVCRLEVFRSKAQPPKAYYMHTEELNKILCVNLTLADCDAIAREQYIQTRVNETMAQLAIRGAEERLKVLRNRSAKTIQLLFRCRQAKKYMRGLMRAVVMRRIDPTTGVVVYYNTMSRTTSPSPPLLMGAAVATLPMESLNWVRRMNDRGELFYFNQETLETSWTIPDGYVLCFKCKLNFVTQRHVATGVRYCVSCFAERIHLERQEANAIGEATDPRKAWTKVVVQAAKCAVCKTSAAAVQCHDCLGDTTCLRCFTILHTNPKLKHHTQHESLLHTSNARAS
ncbi:hypothetical protein SDRG_09318 [Saprolegnia diclina VS20]|uniref:WW domain-containing protein n=1 Tax=Saprolegnia diclina (strain VS20) TaxID=1156394 RepID=T0RSX4_SAPDV|nr:hypothetical protein SDRG_09318 [Saprolegnia diclina VS20]EQC33342.1 hypothetical protein SDRG_09318 [Saprolegnia diclina VS20]|eukprot:XP_008613465.1 hypothetical protein SDRG_09318 [Saprolegnia diclina VS20]